jgi:hypothetical protein
MACPQVADVRWVCCRHGMARPQVADRGDGLQVWRVAANVLNKKPRTPVKVGEGVGGGSSSVCLDAVLTTPRNKYFCYEIFQRASDSVVSQQWLISMELVSYICNF